MSKFFGIHTIALKPGVKAEDFEKFVREELPSFVIEPGHEVHFLKGIRGERDGRYLILFEVESVEARDRLFTPDGERSEEAKRHEEAHPENAKIGEKMSALVGGFGVIYTDYVEID